MGASGNSGRGAQQAPLRAVVQQGSRAAIVLSQVADGQIESYTTRQHTNKYVTEYEFQPTTCKA